MRIEQLAALSLKSLLLSLAACLSAASAAERTAYKVEMLIFTHEDGSMAAGGEIAHPLSDSEKAIDLTAQGAGEYFHALPDTELALATAKSILEQSGDYEVIQNVAWVQPGLDENAAIPVRIHGGAEYQRPSPSPAQPRLGFENPDLLTEPQAPAKLEQIDGTVKVAVNQYLHVYTDLVLRKPMAIQSFDANQPSRRVDTLYQFRIQNERRMQSGDLYYLDHPLLGVLVEITPVEVKPPNQAKAAAPASKAAEEGSR